MALWRGALWSDTLVSLVVWPVWITLSKMATSLGSNTYNRQNWEDAVRLINVRFTIDKVKLLLVQFEKLHDHTICQLDTDAAS